MEQSNVFRPTQFYVLVLKFLRFKLDNQILDLFKISAQK
jgi:hypothetical protein